MDFEVKTAKCLDLESASLRYCVYQSSDKTENFEFLGSNFPQNGFWGWNFKSQNLGLESTPPWTTFNFSA